MKPPTSIACPGSPVSETVSWPTLAAVLLTAVFFSGCAGVIPIPPSSSKPVAGRVIKRSNAAFIKPGLTTRREVEQQLGQSTREFPRWGVAAYTWEKPSWEWVGFIALPMGATETGSVISGGWHALLISYDQEGRVRKQEIIGLRHRETLDDQVERWLGR